jgi:hypothetical protein
MAISRFLISTLALAVFDIITRLTITSAIKIAPEITAVTDLSPLSIFTKSFGAFTS